MRFLVSITATFRVLYVFVAMEIGSRRILHVNVTDHPTAEWSIQQFREFLPYDHPYPFAIHDRDAIFSAAVDSALKDFGVCAIKTPVRTPGFRVGEEAFNGIRDRKRVLRRVPFPLVHDIFSRLPIAEVERFSSLFLSIVPSAQIRQWHFSC